MSLACALGRFAVVVVVGVSAFVASPQHGTPTGYKVVFSQFGEKKPHICGALRGPARSSTSIQRRPTQKSARPPPGRRLISAFSPFAAALVSLDGLDHPTLAAGVAAASGVAGVAAARALSFATQRPSSQREKSLLGTRVTKKNAARRMRLAELARHDGKALPSTSGLYVGADGLVFDVSSAAHLYGPDGPYAAFAGRDASRLFATGATRLTEEEEEAAQGSSFRRSLGENAAKPLSLGERAALKAWVAALRTKYPVIATLETKIDLDLIDAARAGDSKDVRRLLDAGADVDAADAAGDGALHAAAEAGDADCCRLLLDAGADILKRGSKNRHAIHFAAEANVNGAGALRVLLAAPGADPRARADDDWTAAHAASRHGNLDALRVLLIALRDTSPAEHSIVDETHCTSLVDPTSKAGVTPLVAAATFGHADVVRTLLAEGADPARTVRGKTALDWARQKGHANVVEILSQWSHAAAGAGSVSSGSDGG